MIACAEDLPQHLALPRGCVANLTELLGAHGARLRLEDRRAEGRAIDARFHGELTPLQEDAVERLLAHDTGVFVAPPGTGKTVVGAYLAAARGRSTLVLVHRMPLLDQWRAQLAIFFGVDAKAIGQIGSGKRRATGRVDVAMIQSLVRDGEVDELVAGYGHVIVDECHHLSAVSFERVLAGVKARFVIGLTATPYRRDGHQPIIHMQCGPVRHVVDPRSDPARRETFAQRLVCRETAFRAETTETDAGIQGLYAALAGDAARNELILDDIIAAVDEGRSPIVLTERRDHLERLANRLRGFARHLVVLQGGVRGRARRAALERLAAIPEDEERLVLATGRYVGEGLDDARLDTLFLALPIAWKGTLVQYAGRLSRLHPHKTEVRIYDYVDARVPMCARMFAKRLRGYRSLGYASKGDASRGATGRCDRLVPARAFVAGACGRDRGRGPSGLHRRARRSLDRGRAGRDRRARPRTRRWLIGVIHAMASDDQGPIEYDMIKSATLANIAVTTVDVTPTSTGDRHVRIEGRLGDDENPDVEWAGFGFIYALGLLSFHDARPRGVSGIDFQERDEWTAGDMLRRLRYAGSGGRPNRRRARQRAA